MDIVSLPAHVLLDKGLYAQALEKARAARRAGRGNPPEWQGLFLSALAHAKLGVYIVLMNYFENFLSYNVFNGKTLQYFVILLLINFAQYKVKNVISQF